MQSVTGRLRTAFAEVASNRGAPGLDGKSIEEVRAHLEELLPKLSEALLKGEYEPGNIRRVWIPKAGGKGQRRGLGIPDVIDRMIQEAVREVLEPLYEPTFHPNSHGFRPGRSCHTAIKQATEYLEDGCDWVVDLDLENFFNRLLRGVFRRHDCDARYDLFRSIRQQHSTRDRRLCSSICNPCSLAIKLR